MIERRAIIKMAEDTSSIASTTATTSLFSTPQQSTGLKTTNKVFKTIADLIKILPTGTVFAFQFLNPLLTNKGHCSTTNRVLAGILLVGCAFSCCLSCFTDSYVEPSNKKLYYGIVTKKGLWLFYDPIKDLGRDLSSYRLQFADFTHAALSLLVFATVALLDDNRVSCYYPSWESQQKTMLKILPAIVGATYSVVYLHSTLTKGMKSAIHQLDLVIFLNHLDLINLQAI